MSGPSVLIHISWDTVLVLNLLLQSVLVFFMVEKSLSTPAVERKEYQYNVE